MNHTNTLWAKLQEAQKIEQAATAAHDEAEELGSGPAYQAAFEAMADARIKLQEAEDAYDKAYITSFEGCPPELIAYAEAAHSDEIEISLVNPQFTPDFQGVETQAGDVVMEFDGTYGVLIRRNAAGQLETVARNDGMPHEVIE